ncbi:hypothetical protein AMTRI_Chr03g48000 [Amborella trichopoda]
MRISSGFKGIAHIGIRKRIDLIQVTIYIWSSNLLIEDVQKYLNSINQKLKIAITRIARPYGQLNILAEYIALQLKNRVSFGKAMKRVIELAEQANTKGIRVQIARLLNGKEIARVEWIREDRVSLQTI